MKTTLLVLCSICTSLIVHGQNFFIKNHSNSSSRTHALLATSDSNYVQAGVTAAGDMLVYKSNRYGDTLWMKTYGGQESDEAIDIVEATTGGYLVLGNSASFGNGNSDLIAIRMDVQGNEIWTKTYGDTWNDEAYSSINTSDGGYMITATGTNTNADAWLLKIDANGTVQWEKTYTQIELSTGSNIIQTSDNGYMLVGKDGANQMKVIKLTSTGDYDWSRVGTPIWQLEMQAIGVRELSNGNFIVYGDEQGPRLNIFVISMDASGNYLWGRTFRRNISSFDSVHDAMETADGGIVLTCGLGMQLGLMKINATGTLQWARNYWNVELSSSNYDYRGKMYSNWTNGYLFSSNDESGIVSTDSLGRVPCYGNGDATLTSAVNNTLTASTSSSSNATSTTTDITTLTTGGFTMSRFEMNNFPNPGASITPDDCTNSGAISLNISGGTAPYTVDWASNCTGTTCTNLATGDYAITITDGSGCVLNDIIEVTHEASPQQICLVTVDPLSQHVDVVWENPTTGHIDAFNVYRESLGSPIQIGIVDYTSPSVYSDLSASLTPNNTSYEYYVSVEDTCGYESQLSQMHKTILLGVANVSPTTTTLLWNLYQGAAVDYQRIYRDPLGNGNWELIDSVDANTTMYLDNAFFADARYRVEAKLISACTANGQTYAGSFSNIALVQEASITEEELTFEIAPNPVNNVLNIRIETLSGATTYQCVNLAGQILKTIDSTEQQLSIDVSDLPKGMYYLRVYNHNRLSVKKFVKQ